MPLSKQCEGGGVAVYDETKPQYHEDIVGRPWSAGSISRSATAPAAAAGFRAGTAADLRCLGRGAGSDRTGSAVGPTEEGNGTVRRPGRPGSGLGLGVRDELP